MKTSLMIFFTLFICSCKSKSNVPVYSSYKHIGSTHLSVLIDSTVAYRDVVDNSFYLELSTKKNVYLAKPYDYNISFPVLLDSLNRIAFYYKDFKFIATGDNIPRLKRFFYFPKEDSVKLFISKAPFKEGKSELGNYYNKKQLFAKIQFDKSNTLLATLSQDTVKYIP